MKNMNNTGIQYHGKITIKKKICGRTIVENYTNSGTVFLQQLFNYALLAGSQQSLFDGIIQLTPTHLRLVKDTGEVIPNTKVVINKRLSIDGDNSGVQITANLQTPTVTEDVRLQLLTSQEDVLAESQVLSSTAFSGGLSQTMILWFLYLEKGE